MNILFVTEDHSKNNYGITSVVSQLADELVAFDNTIRIIIVTTAAEPVLQHKNVIVEIVPPMKVGRFWGWSPILKKRLGDLVVKYQIDLIHIHGIWMAAQFMALSVARKSKIPCLISTHGMLETWLWESQNWLKKLKKKIYFKFFVRKAITEQIIFHAITPIEKQTLQFYFPKQNIVVIPNAIGLEPTTTQKDTKKILKPAKNIVFLGRLHPVKGIELLFKAFAAANLTMPWTLIIAGPKSSLQYVNKLELLVSSLKISHRVRFVGSVYGDEKVALLQDAWVMVAPSYSEVVGMVNLEAAAYKLPSITTYETGLWDWEEGGGILVHPKIDEIKNALIEASQWSMEERLLRGEKSRKLAQEKYSWDTAISQWIKFYSEIIIAGD